MPPATAAPPLLAGIAAAAVIDTPDRKSLATKVGFGIATAAAAANEGRDREVKRDLISDRTARRNGGR